ncbi:MAG: dTDP-4-dehydrorhamnose 3,5-epimerase [Anaerolineaceae bacterium]|nr:dTDP-4-dehydrorhamnose 3,5-epimerase [Anaerolineaceae bacterium]
MKFTQSKIPDVVIVEPTVFGDHRGYFMETFHIEKFKQAGLPTSFLQQNQSGSTKGILRGLHYQIQHAQGKLVRVLNGEIFDVAVDLRKKSATFGQWVGEILSGENKKMLWVPPGFAHGFLVLSDMAEVFYNATDVYAPQYERTLLWNDPDIGIQWPMDKIKEPILSDKDKNGKLIKEVEIYE